MLTFIITIHIIIAILVIISVLLQQGKGTGMSSSFSTVGGSGRLSPVFGGRGAAPFLFKCTVVLMVGFFLNSLVLGYLGKAKISPVDYLASSQQKVSNQSFVEKNNLKNNTSKSTIE